jgi:hypothetical protein
MNPTDEFNPGSLWRRLCEVTDRLFLCGDLPHNQDGFSRMLQEWVDAGITHIVDVREEWSDESRVASERPEINYAWMGTHDNGGTQDRSWFDHGVAAISGALADPDARVVVHCHMGVNRAPSMVFAALLALGYDIEDGLNAIRNARPIAAILYAEDAAAWFADHSDWDTNWAAEMRMQIRAWHATNPVDVAWVIRRIRRAGREAA